MVYCTTHYVSHMSATLQAVLASPKAVSAKPLDESAVPRTLLAAAHKGAKVILKGQLEAPLG